MGSSRFIRPLFADPVETLTAAEILVKEGSPFCLHQCRSGVGKTIAGRWHCDGDAARFANRE
jgi:hypothetical protein